LQATCVLLFHLKHDITTEIAILLPSALAASFSEAVPLEEKKRKGCAAAEGGCSDSSPAIHTGKV